MTATMKVYAHTYNPTTKKHIEIGGTKESIKKDLRDMEKLGLINQNCTVDIYAVNERGVYISLMNF